MPHSNKQMISFFLETRCKLRCIYCYNSEERADRAKKEKESTLRLDIAVASINEYFKENCGVFDVELDEPQERHIRFYGPGEATEEEGFVRMQEIVNYAKKVAKEANFELTTELQTNGAFNEEVREWVLENIDLLWISFDGTPNIHDKQRPMVDDDDNIKCSSETIEENIKWLIENKNNRKRQNEFVIGLRSTITNESINHQKDMIDYFKKLGINYIWSDPEFPAVGKDVVCKDVAKMAKYNFDLIAYVAKYVEAYRYAKSKGVFYGSFLACNFDGKTETNCRACLPVPHITPDGYVSACDLVLSGGDEDRPQHMDCFIYGKWDDSKKEFNLKDKIYVDRKRELKARKVLSLSLEGCKRCIARHYCSGYCPGEVVNETGELNGQLNGKNNTRNVCIAIRLLHMELFKEITADLQNQDYHYGKEVIKNGQKQYEYKYPHP